MENAHSIARVVLDTIDGLRRQAGPDTADPHLAGLSIREVTLSIPYDPGADKPPVSIPGNRSGESALPLAKARRILANEDREVVLERPGLKAVPGKRIRRLTLTVRLPGGEPGPRSEA